MADASPADLAAGLLYSFDMDGDGVYETTGGSASVSRSYNQDGLYTVRAKVTDKDGGTSVYSTTVEVRNVAPVIGGFSTNAQTIGSAHQGSTVTASATFSDVGKLDLHTAVIDWGDGTTSPATVSEANGVGTISGSHVYSSGGAFTVTLRVADDASPAGVATATSQAIVTGPGLGSASDYVRPRLQALATRLLKLFSDMLIAA
jgi:hypothetical protein